jgi:hypothetical protein
MSESPDARSYNSHHFGSYGRNRCRPMTWQVPEVWRADPNAPEADPAAAVGVHSSRAGVLPMVVYCRQD